MAYKVFIDTNVFLDAFLEGTDDWTEAVEVLQLAEMGHIKPYTSSSCLLNAIYSLKTQKKLTGNDIIKIMTLTISYTDLINPSGIVFLQALQSGFVDLEDAVQYFTAMSDKDIDYFITSNIKDFKKASAQLPVVSPKQFMKLYLKR